jgi:hypothetical protein
MVYSWLLQHCNRPLANVLIFIWYVLLLMLVIGTIDMQPGRFRYLKW